MRYWLGVVSKDHVLRGVEGGFAQVCHGKKGPLQRLKKGDWLVYYSPKQSMNGAAGLQEFTAIGEVRDDIVFQFEMNESFRPFRRQINYIKGAKPLPIEAVKSELELTAASNWGYQLRLGLLELSKLDFKIIHAEMTQ
jgi:EVE domain